MALKSPCATCSCGKAVIVPHRVRRRGVIDGEVFRPLPGGDHGESAGARPVHLLADEGRLVAVGERVDDPRLRRPPRKERTRQGVGLDVDHDDRLLVPAAGEDVDDPRGGVSRGVDDHVEAGRGDHGRGIVGDERRAVGQGVRECCRRTLTLRPAGPPERLNGPRRGEVGDGGQMDPGGAFGLGQVHAAELAGADQADPEGSLFPVPFRQEGMEVHGFSLQPGKEKHPSHHRAVERSSSILSLPADQLQPQRQPPGAESHRDRDGRDAAEAPDGAEGGVPRLFERCRRLSRRRRGDDGVVRRKEPLQFILEGEAKLQGLEIGHAPPHPLLRRRSPSGLRSGGAPYCERVPPG